MNTIEFKNTKDTLVQDLLNNVASIEDNLLREALFIHTGRYPCAGYLPDLMNLLPRLTQQVRGKVKVFLLDGVEILEIHGLTHKMDGATMNTNFQYRIYPKE